MSYLDVFGVPYSSFPPRSNRYEKLANGLVSDWILATLKTVATKNMAPTIASRFYFLCATTIHEAISVILPDWNHVDMYKDIGTFTYSLKNDEHHAWIELAIHDGLYEIYRHLNLPLTELDIVSQNHARKYRRIYRMINSPNISMIRYDWQTHVKTYLANRGQDGSSSASIFKPDDELPNRDVYISADLEEALTQDLTTIPQPNLWCPLEINQNLTKPRQTYLTPQWGDVVGLISTTECDDLVTYIGEMFFPSSEVHAQEVKELAEICESLSKKDKLIAEFWAGGPGTCTPPGFWMYFARCCAITKGLDIPSEALLFYKMSASLFQVGILAWKLKRTYLQLRPIQAIRQVRPEYEMKHFDGRTISSKQWVPYQEDDFVTPPFPDFVSGHSSFSSIGARVLTDFFGTNVIPTNKQLSTEYMYLLSPILYRMDLTCDMCSITVYPKQSRIQSSLPDTGLNLAWTTWDDMAVDAGKSRIYGGIHYESSNQGGLALGRNLYTIMWS